MSDVLSKDKGRAIAHQMSEATGKKVEFIGRIGKRLSFQITQKKLYKVIDIDGNETPAELTDNVMHPRSGEYVYSEVCCYPVQIDNGDLEFFIRKGFTQNKHERFE